MGNNFKKRKVLTMTVGEELKSLRESRGLTLREVAAKTKIQEAYLKALETGHYQDLPADVYVKGFIKGYADFLNLDSKDYLKRYIKERGIHSNIEEVKTPVPKKTRSLSRRSFIITPKKTITGIIVLLVLLILSYIYYQVNSFVSPPKLSIETPAENIRIRGNSITVTGQTDPEATLTINGQPVFVSESGYFNENVTLKEGSNFLKIVAVGFSGKKTEATREVIVERRGEVASGEVAAGEVGGEGEELVLKVAIKDEPTWLSIDSDGKNVYSGVMIPGSSESFSAKERINVTSGKANQTEIFLNGRFLGVLDDSPGAVRDVEFTRGTEFKE